MRVSSSLWVSVSLPGGGTVWWDGRARVSCQLPPSYTSSTRGLCGTLTGSQQDELLSPQGDLESIPDNKGLVLRPQAVLEG